MKASDDLSFGVFALYLAFFIKNSNFAIDISKFVLYNVIVIICHILTAQKIINDICKMNNI